MQLRRCAAKISRQVCVELCNRFAKRRRQSVCVLSCMRAHHHCHKLWRGRHTKNRNVKARVISLLIKRSLHQRFGNNTNDGTPRLRLGGIKYPHTATQRIVVSKIFLREARGDDRDGLFRVVIIDREVAALKNFQSDRRK